MTTPLATSDTPETPQRRPRLSIVGFILCVIAFGLLFVPSFGPFIAIPCAAIGLVLCIVSYATNKNKKNNLTNFGLLLNLVLFVVAVVMSANIIDEQVDFSQYDTPEAAPSSTGTDQSCEELAQIIHDGEELGLSFEEIYALMLRGASESEIDAELDRCADYFQSR